MLNSFLSLQKDSEQDNCHSSGLNQRKSGILSVKTVHKENGTESLNRWWSDSEKADTQFSEPRVHCPEELSKAKEVENYQYASVPMGIRLKLFFAQLFLLISSEYPRSSLRFVWRIQSLPCKTGKTCTGRTIWPIVCAARRFMRKWCCSHNCFC